MLYLLQNEIFINSNNKSGFNDLSRQSLLFSYFCLPLSLLPPKWEKQIVFSIRVCSTQTQLQKTGLKRSQIGAFYRGPANLLCGDRQNRAFDAGAAILHLHNGPTLCQRVLHWNKRLIRSSGGFPKYCLKMASIAGEKTYIANNICEQHLHAKDEVVSWGISQNFENRYWGRIFGEGWFHNIGKYSVCWGNLRFLWEETFVRCLSSVPTPTMSNPVLLLSP